MCKYYDPLLSRVNIMIPYYLDINIKNIFDLPSKVLKFSATSHSQNSDTCCQTCHK